MKTIIKIITSPIVFVMHLAFILAGLIFPTTMIIIFSFTLFILSAIVWFLNLGIKEKIKVEEPFFGEQYGNLIGHFLGTTCIVWFPFYSVWYYWKEDKIIAFEMGI